MILCLGNSKYGEIDIRWNIFPGASLSPSVIVVGLILLSLVLRKADAVYEVS